MGPLGLWFWNTCRFLFDHECPARACATEEGQLIHYIDMIFLPEFRGIPCNPQHSKADCCPPEGPGCSPTCTDNALGEGNRNCCP